MVFFPKVLAFFRNPKHLTKVSRLLVWFGFFFLRFIIYRLEWIFLWIFGCIVSISSFLICTNFDFIKCFFIKDLPWKHICGVLKKVYRLQNSLLQNSFSGHTAPYKEDNNFPWVLSQQLSRHSLGWRGGTPRSGMKCLAHSRDSTLVSVLLGY
jgi:hypothetical protein